MWHREPCSPECLLTKPKLTFTKAVTIAQAEELAEKGSKEIQSTCKDLPKDIHKFSNATNSRSSQKHKDVPKDKPPACSCYHCGGKHSHSTCRFKSEVCHFCNKRGHIARVCKTRMAQSTLTKPPIAGDSSKPTHQVTQDSPCDTSSSEYTYIITLPSQQSKPLKAGVEVEGHHVNMEIDMEAAVSIISDKIYTSLPNTAKNIPEHELAFG